jgi:hypothetical protein
MRIDLGTPGARTGYAISDAQAAAVKTAVEAKSECMPMDLYSVSCDPEYGLSSEIKYRSFYHSGEWNDTYLYFSCAAGGRTGSYIEAMYPGVDPNFNQGLLTVSGMQMLYSWGIKVVSSGVPFFPNHAMCPLSSTIPVVGTSYMPYGFYDSDGVVLPFSIPVDCNAGGTSGRAWLAFPDARLLIVPDTSCSAAFYAANAYWYFGGTGTVSDKFTADITIEGYLGYRPSIKIGKAGVVHITADSVSQDCIFQIFRNATSVYAYGVPNCNDPGDHPPAALSTTFSVSVGDVITLGDPTDFHNCTNLQVWWTAT